MKNSQSLEPISAVIPEIIIHNSRAVTTSIAVANYFQKRHDNVIDKIRAVMADCDPAYHLLNFKEVVREVPGGDGAMRKMPMFELTRDAFVLIVMGFTGKKALQWKIDYINAFNKMEAELHQRAVQSQGTDMLPGNSRAVLVYFDESGGIKYTQTVPEDATVCTVEIFRHWMEQNGWLVINKKELRHLTVEQLVSLK
jgi:Rha family phage regulatory protein